MPLSLWNGQLLRAEERTYQTYYDQSDRYLLGLPATETIRDGANNQVARSELLYDEEGSYPLLPCGATAGWSDPPTTVRGNATTVRRWLNTTNNYLATHAQYDRCGNLRKAWDARGNLTETDYAAAYQHAYPTTVTSPVPDPSGQHGSTTALVTTTTYDFTTGLVTATTDANGQATQMEYNDPLRRPTRVVRPAGGGETQYEYGNAPGDLYVRVRTQREASAWVESRRYFDGLGRPARDFLFKASGYIVSDTEYDTMGRAQRVSNPYRTTTLSGTVPASGQAWTTTEYDALGRALSVTTPDGAMVSTTYSGNSVTVTDQAGRQRRSVSDGLGRLTQVYEAPNDANYNYLTSYSYDALGNLRTVTQGQQTRTFVYDSLARLTSATNSESGTISYSYDANGNLETRTDARSIVTSYTYDALNRVKTRSYSDATPAVSYVYDAGGVSNSRGRLTRVSSSVSATNYTEYDALGRVKASSQVTEGVTYNFSYAYDLAGNLTSQTYPSGRVVTTGYDAAVRVNAVTGQQGQTTTAYAAQFAYAPHGAVSQLQLGNGRWEHTLFNNRLQPTEIGLGTSATDSSLWQVSYSYNTPNQVNNNGNALTQMITAPGFTATQSYTYDSLNRLESAQESNSTGQSWTQGYVYDRYGNRQINTATTTPALVGPNPSISTANNRITAAGYSYDLAGNLTQEPGQGFTYDGENRLRTADTGQTAGQASYQYDGDGRRVKKETASGVTFFVYNAMGQLIAEYSTQAAQANGTSYLTQDHLGSPRVITDSAGAVRSRRDFLPFGEELQLGRSGVAGYGVQDNVRQQFTSYERDNETGLDFAQARYYHSIHGRFTSTDPVYFQTMMAIDPQRFNLYAYARNNPLKWVDPDGERVYLRGDTDFLRTEVLYEMVGGQENFDRYFEINEGEVVLRSGVDLAGANAGVQELAGYVNATENYLYFAGTDGAAAADLFQGSRDAGGRPTRLGRDRVTRFEGNNDQRAGGYLLGTSGRPGQLQPANLANGDPVFAVIAYNTNAVLTQTGVSGASELYAGGVRMMNRDSQVQGLFQRIRPVSFFIHETAENREFARIGPRNENYWRAHHYARHREGIIRRELNITGGFSGALVQSRVPRR